MRSSDETFHSIGVQLLLEDLALPPRQPLDVLRGACSIHRIGLGTSASQALEAHEPQRSLTLQALSI